MGIPWSLANSNISLILWLPIDDYGVEASGVSAEKQEPQRPDPIQEGPGRQTDTAGQT